MISRDHPLSSCSKGSIPKQLVWKKRPFCQQRQCQGKKGRWRAFSFKLLFKQPSKFVFCKYMISCLSSGVCLFRWGKPSFVALCSFGLAWLGPTVCKGHGGCWPRGCKPYGVYSQTTFRNLISSLSTSLQGFLSLCVVRNRNGSQSAG